MACAPTTPLMAGCSRAIGACLPDTRQVITAAPSEGFSQAFSQADRMAGSSSAFLPSTLNTRFPPASKASPASVTATRESASSGFHVSKKRRIAAADGEPTPCKNARCRSLAASKHCRARSGLPFASMPSR